MLEKNYKISNKAEKSRVGMKADTFIMYVCVCASLCTSVCMFMAACGYLEAKIRVVVSGDWFKIYLPCGYLPTYMSYSNSIFSSPKIIKLIKKEY